MTNCSQTFRDRKEVNFMGKKQDPIESRKFVRAFSLVFSRKKPFPRMKKMEGHSWPFLDGGNLANAVSKIVTTMVRLSDQDERQSDAAFHWDTVRPVLLKAFAKREHEISMKDVGYM